MTKIAFLALTAASLIGQSTELSLTLGSVFPQ